MVVSQNGYSANDPNLMAFRPVPGTAVKLRVRNGPAGDLLIYAATRWHREVEPLTAPDGVLDCWGYASRPIRGGTELSNHASGTAIDLRARAHPLGTDPNANFLPAQRTAARRIVADCKPALRWGGDYIGRKDGMHLEIVADEKTCAQVVARLNPEDIVTPQEIDAIADRVWAKLIDNYNHEKVSAPQILQGIEQKLADLKTQIQQLRAKP